MSVPDAAALSELVRRWWTTVWLDGDVDGVSEIVTDPVVRHTSSGSHRTTLSEYKDVLRQSRRVLQRATTTIDDEVVHGDRIWVRATSRGVNLEAGEPAIVTWMIVFRVDPATTKLAEYWLAVIPGVSWEA